MKLAIIGPGLIGRSVALAALRADPGIQITEIDRGDSLESARGAELIVLATPVDAILDIIRDHSDALRSSVTLDTGSTKRAILTAARQAGLGAFVGGHPMAGGTTSGPGAARADLFENQPWFLVPHGAADSALRLALAFVKSLRARPVIVTDDGTEHDRVMASVSHLPQIVASTLMDLVARTAGEHLRWAGSGLRDTTRLAQSSGAVWASILDSNAEELRPLLRDLARRLETLADALGDGDTARELFDRANRARALL